MADKKLHVTVITPARSVLSTPATAVVVPAFDGEMGVLPGHAPMLAMLGTGELRVTADDKTRCFAIRGGFLQVNRDQVTILTEESAAPAEIDLPSLDAQQTKLDAEQPMKLDERELRQRKRDWLKAQRRLAERK